MLHCVCTPQWYSSVLQIPVVSRVCQGSGAILSDSGSGAAKGAPELKFLAGTQTTYESVGAVLQNSPDAGDRVVHRKAFNRNNRRSVTFDETSAKGRERPSSAPAPPPPGTLRPR